MNAVERVLTMIIEPRCIWCERREAEGCEPWVCGHLQGPKVDRPDMVATLANIPYDVSFDTSGGRWRARVTSLPEVVARGETPLAAAKALVVGLKAIEVLR